MPSDTDKIRVAFISYSKPPVPVTYIASLDRYVTSEKAPALDHREAADYTQKYKAFKAGYQAALEDIASNTVSRATYDIEVYTPITKE